MINAGPRPFWWPRSHIGSLASLERRHVAAARRKPFARLFIGATLTATSVGITARVFKDLDGRKAVKRGSSSEPRSSTMCSDSGLILTGVAGTNNGDGRRMPRSDESLRKRFFWSALTLGSTSQHDSSCWRQLEASGVLLATGLSFCFFLSWLPQRSGSRSSSAPLAPD